MEGRRAAGIRVRRGNEEIEVRAAKLVLSAGRSGCRTS